MRVWGGDVYGKWGGGGGYVTLVGFISDLCEG